MSASRAVSTATSDTMGPTGFASAPMSIYERLRPCHGPAAVSAQSAPLARAREGNSRTANCGPLTRSQVRPTWRRKFVCIARA